MRKWISILFLTLLCLVLGVYGVQAGEGEIVTVKQEEVKRDGTVTGIDVTESETTEPGILGSVVIINLPDVKVTVEVGPSYGGGTIEAEKTVVTSVAKPKAGDTGYATVNGKTVGGYFGYQLKYVSNYIGSTNYYLGKKAVYNTIFIPYGLEQLIALGLEEEIGTPPPRPNCPEGNYLPASTNSVPITVEQAAQGPIKFSWGAITKWGSKCSEGKDHRTYFDISQRYFTPEGTIDRSVVRAQAARNYSWTPPSHYRYVDAYDNAKKFAFSEGWTRVNAVGDGAVLASGKMLGSSMSQTNVKGAMAVAEIETDLGEGFILRYVARPFGGKMQVYIDGKEAGIIDQEVDRDICPWQLRWDSSSVFSDLSDGPHHVTLSHNSYYDNLAWIDALIIGDTVYDIGGTQAGPITFPQPHPNTWSTLDFDESYGGSEIYSRASKPATFDFTGKNFSIIYHQAPYSGSTDCKDDGECNWHDRHAGVFTVTVDGVAKTFNQTAIQKYFWTAVPSEYSLWRYNQEWQSPILSKGKHTVILKHVDDRFNKYINVDAIITDNVQDGPTTEGSYNWAITPENCAGYQQSCPVIPLYITLGDVATPSAEAWYQFVDGSGYAKSGKISVTVPETASDNDQRVLMGKSGGDSTKSSGLLMSALTNGIDIFSYVGFTSRNWTVPDSNYFTPPQENFTYIKRLFELGTSPDESFKNSQNTEVTLPVGGTIDDWKTANILPIISPDTALTMDGSTPESSYVYYHTGDLTIADPLVVNDGTKRTIFVKGNVTINADVTVPVSNFLSIVASGNITIAGTVSKVQGLYVSDKVITIQDGEGSGTSGLGDSRQFESQGSLVGWGGVQLQRTLSEEANASYPAEKFIYRPDFIINAPSLYKRFGIQWREVAPGGVTK